MTSSSLTHCSSVTLVWDNLLVSLLLYLFGFILCSDRTGSGPHFLGLTAVDCETPRNKSLDRLHLFLFVLESWTTSWTDDSSQIRSPSLCIAGRWGQRCDCGQAVSCFCFLLFCFIRRPVFPLFNQPCAQIYFLVTDSLVSVQKATAALENKGLNGCRAVPCSSC